MLHDLRFALRSLLKTPGFTLVAVLTMAVAIGACTSLFSVLQAVVLRPLPYPNPNSLVNIWGIDSTRGGESPTISWRKFELMRARTDVFAAISMSAGNSFTLTEGSGDPEQVFGLHASANFLPILGITPVIGRQFTDAEDQMGGPDVVMISHQLWQTRFNGDPNIIGRSIQIDSAPRTVVGVLPAHLPPPFSFTSVIVPRPIDLPYLPIANIDNGITHQAIARLAPGVTLEQANRRVAEMAQQFKAANPKHVDAVFRNEVRLLSQQVLGDLGRTFWTLAGAVAAVLLIACANVANLFLARVSTRQKEIAVRMSLGARSTEVIRQFIAESVVFSAIAGALGVMLAWWSIRGIQLLAGQQLPRADEIALNPGVLIFSVGVALVAALLIGIYPALQAARTDVQTVLKDTTRGSGGGSAAKSFRQFLVVAQVAMSLTLLICAGLLVLSFHKLQKSDLGFATEGRAYGLINLPAAKYNTPELRREFYLRLQERLDQTPEFAVAGAAFGVPLTGNDAFSPYAVQGRPVPAVTDRPIAATRIATVGYAAAIGLKLREGRFFTADDRNGAPGVVLINESLAKKLFPGESAIDKNLLTGRDGTDVVRIVGVIRDVKALGLTSPAPDEIYFPRSQRGGASMVVVALAKPGLRAAATIPVLRHVLKELDPNLALAQAETVEDLVSNSIGVQRVTMALLITFAGIAALLAAVGIYSVMAYAVTQRTGEIGVRMALGANTGNILRLILRGAAASVGLGLALGLGGALIGSRLLQQALYDVKPFDPAVFAAVATLFALVAALACVIPALRATRIDPTEALRTE